MSKLEKAIRLIEQSAAMRDLDVDEVLDLLRAHQQDDLCFGNQFTKLTEALSKMRSRHQTTRSE